jgi:hypothetical protein
LGTNAGNGHQLLGGGKEDVVDGAEAVISELPEAQAGTTHVSQPVNRDLGEFGLKGVTAYLGCRGLSLSDEVMAGGGGLG